MRHKRDATGVRSEGACKIAAGELSLLYEYASEEPTYPLLCYVYAADNRVYFNNHSTGSFNAAAAPICSTTRAPSRAPLPARRKGKALAGCVITLLSSSWLTAHGGDNRTRAPGEAAAAAERRRDPAMLAVLIAVGVLCLAAAGIIMRLTDK
jgi:hypothetical protein